MTDVPASDATATEAGPSSPDACEKPVVAHGWRTSTGRAVAGAALALLVAVVAVDLLSDSVMLVVGDRVLESARVTFTVGPVAGFLGLVGWVLLRVRGRVSDTEVGVIAAVVAGCVLALVAQVWPGVVVVMWLAALPTVLLVGPWRVVAGAAAVVTGAVVLVRRRRARRGEGDRGGVPGLPWRATTAVGVACCTLSGVCALLGSAILGTEDSVALVRGPGGCAVVLHEDQLLHTGEVSVYRVAPGSPVALVVESFVVDGDLPVREEAYAVTFHGPDARVVLGDVGRVTVAACT